MVSTLTSRILRLRAIDPASDGAFESCALAEYSNNISGRRRRFGTAWRLVEDHGSNLMLTYHDEKIILYELSRPYILLMKSFENILHYTCTLSEIYRTKLK